MADSESTAAREHLLASPIDSNMGDKFHLYNETAYRSKTVTDPEHFSKRVCTTASLLNNQSKYCSGCKENYLHGKHKWSTSAVWSYENNTELEKTDAYGDILFTEFKHRKASYIRIENKTSPSDMIQYLYDTWKLDMPHLIISVTGGAQNFTIPERMKTAFKRGLMKAATSTGAWIITGGTNTGVMRLVGEAVAEEFKKVTCIGIATWGKIAYRDKLVRENQMSTRPMLVQYPDKLDKNSKDVQLDHNHTHFLLIDDGSVGEFGKEIEFRAELENELRRRGSGRHALSEQNQEELKIPMILIVVQGGPNTLKTVYESIFKKIPVLVLANSSGCADLVANACAIESPSEMDERELELKLKTLIEKSNLFLKETKVDEPICHLKTIVLSQANLINIFRLDNDDYSQDIELSILRAFLNSQRENHYDNLKLAIIWNKCDIAKSDIDIGKIEMCKLETLFEMALVENRAEFVELLLENGVSLKNFLTVRRLLFLYNSTKIQKTDKKAPLYQLRKREKIPHKHVTPENILKLCAKFDFNLREDKFFEEDNDEKSKKILICTNNLNEFLLMANDYDTSDFECESVELKEYGVVRFKWPAQNLLLWALFHNRIELGKLFWQIGDHQICIGLFSSGLLKRFSDFLPDLREGLLKSADEFESLSIGVLSTFDDHTDDLVNGAILLRKISYLRYDSLEIAFEASCMNFLSQRAVQNLLTDIWFGQMTQKSGYLFQLKLMLSGVSLGFLAPFLVYDDVAQVKDLSATEIQICESVQRIGIARTVDYKTLLKGFDNTSSGSNSSNSSDYTNEKSIRNRCETYWHQVYKSITSPYFRYFLHFAFYLIFLILFSYMMLCDYTFLTTVRVKINSSQLVYNLSINSSYLVEDWQEIDKVVVRRNLTWLQYLIIIWICSFAFEEVRQMITDPFTKKFTTRISTYFKDHWNYLDLLGCFVFFAGLTCQSIGLSLHQESWFIASRIVFCFDLSIWYIRLLHVLLIFKSLGPKLAMIKKMLRDLIFFIAILAIFICAFGVTTQATMYPNSELSFSLFKSIIDKAYWPLYGEIKTLGDDIEGEACNKDDPSTCADPAGVVYSYVLLMLYMMISNVLLLNLLIAMFSSTFQDVQENTDIVWKYQRYRLVFEYLDSPILPAPLSLIPNTYTIIYRFFKKVCDCRDKCDANAMSNKFDVASDFERHFADVYIRNEKQRMRDQINSRVKYNSERLEVLEQRLNEMIELMTKKK